MRMPLLCPPVKRPHFIQPAECVNIDKGRLKDLLSVRIDLLHGANYNDPQVFANRSFNQVMHSSTSNGWGGFASMGRLF